MTAGLTNHLWQSTLFVLAAALVAATLRKNRAAIRYWVWFAASLKFLVPYSVLIALGSQLGNASTMSPATSPNVPALSLAMAQIAQPFSGSAPFTMATPHAAPGWAAAALLVVWAVGFGAIAVLRWRSWQGIRAVLGSSLPLTSLGIETPSNVQIRSSAGVLEPAVVGFWHQVLLLPAGVQQYLPPRQLAAVVAHELCHIRRRDNLTAAIHMIVEMVFWFHPVVWWIGARLVDERERSCDEHVLRLFGEPRPYAEGILNICRLYVESPLAIVSGVGGSQVKKRIEDIMIRRIGLRLSIPRKLTLALAATVAVVAPIGLGMTTAPLRAQSVFAKIETAQPRTQSESDELIRMKEAVLKYALFQMRDAIDQYHADNNQYPRSLDSLVSAEYLPQIPADPFTNRIDSWRTIPSESDSTNTSTPAGIHDVKSGSGAPATDGTRYSDW